MAEKKSKIVFWILSANNFTKGANYSLATGEQKKEISPNFIDKEKAQVVTKLR